MKFIKSKKNKNQMMVKIGGTQLKKRKRWRKLQKRNLKLSILNVWEKVTLHLNVPKRKRKKKVIQVTWS